MLIKSFRYSSFKFFGGLSLIFCWSTLTFADELTPVTHLHVANEVSRQNGVLISRPQPLYQKIVDLITRNKIASLEDYAKWLEDNIRYQHDGKIDTWASAEETLQRKIGDCEDYVLLNISVLEVLGYRPHFIALVRNGRRTHAICTFEHNGHILWFDNAKLKKTSMTSLNQLAKKIGEQYNYSTLLEFNRQTKNWNVLYKKS